MPRNELSAQAAAELAALEKIINREPVGEEHLELAALVDSVRADAPQMTAEFSARLEAGFASRRVRADKLRRLPRARFALAGGTLVAALAAVAIVGGSGVLSSNAPVTPTAGLHKSAGAQTMMAGHPNFPPSSAAAGGAASAPGAPTASTTPVGTFGPAAQGAAQSGLLSSTQSNGVTNPAARLVARGAALTLSSTPDHMQTVADEVVATTQHLGGIVENSNVNVHGMSSYASFSLSVPAGQLSALITQLSSLAGVRALDQNTLDITSSYNDAVATLADERAERTALISALAQATTLTQTQTIQQKITALDATIAGSEHHVGSLLSRGHNAAVSVDIVASTAAAGSGGSGPISRALDDALRVLDVTLAIALVALAVLLPFALCGLIVWWGAASLRQRSRERAIEVSAQ